MNFKKVLVFVIAVMLVFSLHTLGKTKKITRIGVSPLICVKGGIRDAAQLREQLEKNADVIKEGFEKAEVGYLYDGFMEQVRSGSIQEAQLPKNQEIPWMVFKVGNKVKVVRDLVWDGKTTLEVFAITVQKDCKDYVIVVPKGCGNITLMDIKNTYATCELKVSPDQVNVGDEVTVDLSGSKCAVKYEVTVFYEGDQVDFKELTDPVWKTKYDKPGNYVIKAKVLSVDGVVSSNDCEAKFSIGSNYPPVCDLKVTPTKGYVGDLFKLDATGSTDKGGQVVKADFTIRDQNGNEVDQNTLTTAPLIWQMKFNKPGYYKIWLKVTDDSDVVSANDCEMEVAVQAVQRRLFGLVEGGVMAAKGTYTIYIFGRLGLFYMIIPERLSVILAAGPALRFSGAPFKNFFMANLLLNLHFSDFFVGGGIGYSTAVRDYDWGAGLDVVGSIGYDIFKGPNKVSIFGEVRIPVRSDLEVSDAHQFLLGMRFLF